MMLDCGTDTLNIDSLRVLNEKNAVGVSHSDCDRTVETLNDEWQMQCIVLAGQGNILPTD